MNWGFNVSDTQTAQPVRAWRWLWDIVSAAPASRGPIAPAVQMLLCTLWMPPACCAALWFAIRGQDWRSHIDCPRFGVQLAQELDKIGGWGDFLDLAWAFIGIGLVALLIGYAPFRAVAGRGRLALQRYARCCWRTCLWGSAWLIPAAVAFGALGSFHPVFEAALLAVPVYLLLGPAYFARQELRRRSLRRSRWRPGCPECGYSIHRLVEPRCPECGATLPTTRPTFRRWARRRLLWDRTQRGNPLIAYLLTLLIIVIRPCRAGREIAMPDRYGRALRWALFHIVIAAAIACLLKRDSEIRHILYVLFNPADTPLNICWNPHADPLAGVPIWAAQCWLAWAIVLTVIPLIGCGLAYIGLNRHAAARRTMVKWSLYACAVLPFACFALQAIRFWRDISYMISSGQSAWRSFLEAFSSTPPPLAPIIAAYALCWASGVANNAYLPHRGAGTFIKYLALYAAFWLLIAYVLYPLGALRCLL